MAEEEPGDKHGEEGEHKEDNSGNLYRYKVGQSLGGIGGNFCGAVVHRLLEGVGKTLIQFRFFQLLNNGVQRELFRGLGDTAVHRDEGSVLDGLGKGILDVLLDGGFYRLGDRFSQGVREKGRPNEGHKYCEKTAEC